MEALQGWAFRLDCEIQGSKYGFSRAVDDKRWIYVDGPTDGWPMTPDVVDGRARVTWKDQGVFLGRALYGLSPDDEAAKFGPTYRSLISYQIRHGRDAFLEPFSHDRNQAEWDRQANVAFQLALNWRDAAELQVLKEERRGIDQLHRLATSGNLPSYLGTEGALEAERVRLQGVADGRAERLRTFEVLDDYREIEAEADKLTEEIHGLVNANVRDRRYADLYSSRIDDERSAVVTSADVKRFFAEAEAEMPDAISRRLNEVETFHQAVIANRQTYLQVEMDRLATNIEVRDEEIAAREADRARLMRILDSKGALDEYNELQRQLAESRGELHDIEARITRLREVTQARADWEARRNTVVRGMRTRYEELQGERDKALTFFNSNSEALYESPGRLIIDVGDTGFKFDVDIDRAGSQGVSNMKIFCFDLALMQLWASRGDGPGVLVHDSTLFDGVDERQIAAALQLAKAESERCDFQYICSMNSDTLPGSELEGTGVLDSIAIELNDRDASGRLLGIEF